MGHAEARVDSRAAAALGPLCERADQAAAAEDPDVFPA